MSMLNRMLWRDLWHLREQIMAAALVVACGLATLVATRGTYHALLVAQQDYYRTARFTDVFAHLKRAPQAVADEIRHLPGVAQVRTRVVVDISADIPGLAEPAIVRLVSIPERQGPMLNDVQILRGRYVAPGAADEVLVSEAFAKANRLEVGSHIGALLHGRWKNLVIVGIAMSPEFVYEVGTGMLFPDNRRYGVLWMADEALAPAFDMQGAFNDVSLTLGAGANEREVLASLDALLQRYGGLAAHGRDEQLSHRFLSDELGEIAVMTTTIPSIFLGVGAFLLYVVLARLVATQRTQVGLLKAFGRTDLRVGQHYLLMAMATVALGMVIGIPLGLYLGELYVEVYRGFFHFPNLRLVVEPGLLLAVIAVSLASAGLGAAVVVWRVVRLAPAEAMRAEPPASFHAGTIERLGLARRLPASLSMIVRNLVRRPWKAAVSALGMALAIGLILVGHFGVDAVNHMMSVQFNLIQREDVIVTYNEPKAPSAAEDIARMDGVMRAEPFRAAPAWLRHGHRSKRIEVIGLTPDHELRRLLDRQLQPVDLPREGLVLNDKLARVLGLSVGDSVTMEVLEGARPVQQVPVVRIVDEYLGLGAYMDAHALTRLLGEEDTSSGAYLRVRADRALALYEQLKRMPSVAGVTVRSALQQSVADTMNRTFLFFSSILTLMASIIVGGMVYNSARIALSERGNELASLSVLGFTQREVGYLLLGEQGLLTLAAIPVGLSLGYGICAALIPAFDRELFRLPLVLRPWSFMYAALAALFAYAVSALIVARRIRHLDLIAVLKTRE